MIDIVGGVYREICLEPRRSDEVFGSGGRAAAAISELCNSVSLHTFASKLGREYAEDCLEALFNIDLNIYSSDILIHFEYFHGLSKPNIYPNPNNISAKNSIEINSEVVLRFGMMEGTAKVHADVATYDPQSESNPEPFHENGSTANHLALISNEKEIQSLSNETDTLLGAEKLLSAFGYEVVVIRVRTH